MDAAGAAGATSGTLTIESAGGKYSLSFGQTYLEIDPMNGARVIALRVGGSTGADVILDESVNAGTDNADNWGSVFWPSPQTWPWPPTDADNSIGVINSSPYTATMDDSSVTLTSGVAAMPIVSVIKKFSADLVKEAVVIDYTVQNGGNEPVTVAPWEITRMGMGSISFYPQGDGAPKAGGFPLPPTTSGAGATWFVHTGDATSYKLLSDGTGGWIASAIGDLILVKTFPDIAADAAAAGEAEIEIFSAQKYVEVEQQGAVQTLAPGASLRWTVRWYARKMAAPATVGSADLVTYVQNLIK